jgi:hypothetical protein
MIFCGYLFDLYPNGSIALDEEMTADMLDVKDGDRFQVSIVNNKVILNKMPPVQIWQQD